MVAKAKRGGASAEGATVPSELAGAAPTAEEGPDLWKCALAAIAAAGTAYGVSQRREAKKQAAAADRANRLASAHHAAAQAARGHAQSMEAKAAAERRRAIVAETRTCKLAMEVANHANYLIAGLRHEDVPPLRFDGCVAAATNGVEILIDMTWLLSGIVDPAKEQGSIFGRIIGVVAHEWFHLHDTARGTRPSHEEELLADGFAGKQLAKLNVVPNHFADLLRVFPQSSTHPDGRLRADTVLEAWTTETQKRAAEAREYLNIIEAQPVEAIVPANRDQAAQIPERRTRKGAAKKGTTAAKKRAAKTGATKKATTATKKSAAKEATR